VAVRVVAALWVVLGVAVWNGFFDLYVSRGAREYGQLRVEHELGRGPEPDMQAVMARAVRDGVRGATIWSVLIVGAGWGTLWVSRPSRAARPGRS
jgi:hypothetical protein